MIPGNGTEHKSLPSHPLRSKATSTWMRDPQRRLSRSPLEENQVHPGRILGAEEIKFEMKDDEFGFLNVHAGSIHMENSDGQFCIEDCI